MLLYDTNNGNLIESLRGHKDTVYSVSYSSDGTHFASGGADNVVVIWKASGQGRLKYNHSSPIQRVVYNPASFQLASCSDTDFGLWSPDQKSVVKEKVGSKILSAAWSSDGTTLAVGMLNGTISLRNQQAEETHRIDRKFPVWCLAFVPNPHPAKISSSTEGEMVVTGSWDKNLTFYRILNNGQHKAHTERNLKFLPTSIILAGSNGTGTSSNSKNHYLIITGSNKKVALYSKEGIRLAELATKDSWVWAGDYHAGTERVIMGTNAGGVELLQLNYDTIHALYREKYAYRENLTDIVIHHLVGDRKVRIKCKDIIRRISLYRNKLAVQVRLPLNSL